MDNRFKGSKTEGNLLTAFTGESMARNKYTFFSAAAKKEGFVEIARIFEETADNEREHAKIWFKLLNQLGDTAFNLQSASDGEHYEWSEMYRSFAEDAKSENFNDVAFLFEKAAEVEKLHQQRFDRYLSEVNSATVFTKKEKVKWKCQNCGLELEAEEAPEQCPLCSHPKGFFKEEPPLC